MIRRVGCAALLLGFGFGSLLCAQPTFLVTASPTSGATTTITETITDSNGFDGASTAQMLISWDGSGRDACYLVYTVVGGTWQLRNDAGTGFATTLSNSQCSVNAALSTATVSPSGTVTLKPVITFDPSFVGTLWITPMVSDVSGFSSGGAAASFTAYPANPAPPTISLPIPSPGYGTSVNLTMQVTDLNGAKYIRYADINIGSRLSPVGGNVCDLEFYAAQNSLVLNDQGGPPVYPPAEWPCVLTAALGSPTRSGNVLTLSVGIGFANSIGNDYAPFPDPPSFSGGWAVTGDATDAGGSSLWGYYGGAWSIGNVALPLTFQYFPGLTLVDEWPIKYAQAVSLASSTPVSTGSSTSWTASSQQSWIHVPPGTRTGNQTLSYTLDSNTTGSARSGKIFVDDTNDIANNAGLLGVYLQINQDSLSFSPPSFSIPADGATSKTVTVTGSGSWSTPTPSASWVRITSAGAGSGSDSFIFSVDPNFTGSPRNASITLGNGGSISISQQASVSIVVTGMSPSTYGSYQQMTATLTPPLDTHVSVLFCDADIVVNQPCSGPSNYFQAQPVSMGTATVTFPFSAGIHHIKASYTGDPNYGVATSTPLTLLVNQASTQLAMTAAPGYAGLSQPISLQASLTGYPQPTGTITFRDGSNVIGSASVSSGNASLTTSTLTLGSHSISAHYNGDSNYVASDSSVSSVLIGPSVQLTDLTQHFDVPSGGTPKAGDSFALTARGAPSQAISVNQNGSGQYTFPFTTGSDGVSTILGTWSSQFAGQSYTQYWQVGGSTALPSPLQFSINASSTPTVELLDTTLNKSYQGGQTTYSVGDSWTLTVYGPPAKPVSVSTDGTTFFNVSCNGTSSPNTDSTGICQINGQFDSSTAHAWQEYWRVDGIATQPGVLSFLVISNGGSAPVIDAYQLPGGVRGQYYSASLSVTGGTSPYTWSLYSGSLPPSVSPPTPWTGATTSLSGFPTSAGQYTFRLQVRDNAGNISAGQDFSISIVDPNTPYVITNTLPTATIGVAYSQTLQAGGGTVNSQNDYTWSCTGSSLPAGLSRSGSVVSGTPTAAGTVTLTCTVRDLAGLLSAPQSVTIAATPPCLPAREYVRLNGRLVALENSCLAQ